MARRLKLLTIGHPYTMHGLRRLPHEMAKAGGDRWDVLAVGPAFYHGSPRFGDLEPAHLVVQPGEAARIAGMPMFVTNNVHFAFWGDAVRRLMRQGEFDVVHSWEEPFNPACGQIARLSPKAAAFCFYTFQNIEKRYPFPFDRIERYTLGRADGWIAAGRLVEETLAPRPAYAEKPHRVLGLGVDVEQFSPNAASRADVRRELGWDDGDPVIGFLGRFTEAKGLPIVMRALDRSSTPWRAIFIGSGELDGQLSEWAGRYGGSVAIRRNLDHDGVAKNLNACDVLMAPSQTTPIWKEQFGRMLVEAFACGVAVLTSDSGEIPFVVGDAALVVPERDEQEWFAAVGRLIDDRPFRAVLADRGLERARARYAWSVVAREHLEFFEQLIERRERSRSA